MTQVGGVSGDAIAISSVSAADSGSTMRDSGAGKYIYNLDTSSAAIGAYRIFVDLGDGSIAQFIDIAFK